MAQQSTFTDEHRVVSPSGAKRHGDAALFVRLVMRPMTIVLNPLMRTLAGRRHVSMFAQIRHHGRRSGRLYTTPASARPTPSGGFLVPLTFGEHSDWCRNVLTAGGCTIRFKGVDSLVHEPTVLDAGDARSAINRTFRPHERVMFRLIGIKKVLRLEAVPTHP